MKPDYYNILLVNFNFLEINTLKLWHLYIINIFKKQYILIHIYFNLIK